jgi:hypothetical protein
MLIEISCCRSSDMDLNISAKQLKLSLPFCAISLLLFAPAYYSNVHAEVLIKDANLTVEKVVKGLEDPIAMSFINSGEILVLGNDESKVMRVVNGHMLC